MPAELEWVSWRDFLESLQHNVEYLGPWSETRRHEQQRRVFEYLRGLVDEPVDYFEFGVAEGASLCLALEVWRDPRNRFLGFDTFEGLPDDWRGVIDGYAVRGTPVFDTQRIFLPRGTFGTGGLDPRERGVVDDPRARFWKGLVEHTLGEALASYQPALARIVNVDINLREPAAHILRTLHPWFRAGDVILFDELYDQEGEFLALRDYLHEFDLARRLRCIATDGKVFAFRFLHERTGSGTTTAQSCGTR